MMLMDQLNSPLPQIREGRIYDDRGQTAEMGDIYGLERHEVAMPGEERR